MLPDTFLLHLSLDACLKKVDSVHEDVVFSVEEVTSLVK